MVGCQCKIPRKTQYLNYNLATQIFFLFVKVAIYGTVLGFGQSRAGAVPNEEKSGAGALRNEGKSGAGAVRNEEKS